MHYFCNMETKERKSTKNILCETVPFLNLSYNLFQEYWVMKRLFKMTLSAKCLFILEQSHAAVSQIRNRSNSVCGHIINR